MIIIKKLVAPNIQPVETVKQGSEEMLLYHLDHPIFYFLAAPDGGGSCGAARNCSEHESCFQTGNLRFPHEIGFLAGIKCDGREALFQAA